LRAIAYGGFAELSGHEKVSAALDIRLGILACKASSLILLYGK